MSLSDRRTVLLGLAALSLAGCGFAPAYGTDGAARGLHGRIRAADPTNRDSFALVGRLEERLGRPDAPLYDLNYELEVQREGLAITPEQVTTRYNLLGEVAFTLTDRRTGAPALSGRVNNFAGYSATGTTVSTRAAEQDAHERLMVILADQIVARLIASAGSLSL
ncbi:LPS assembly lipoprotein LptE [Actibacterium sp. D379-3]